MEAENEKILSSWTDFLDLPVSLSFELGRAKLTIREILDIGPSSIIKLSRSTGEGIDIRVDNRPLMRGEIVVMEDRAGVRVSEILTEAN
jgi:flagellar motor switch protein FliN/FliY